MARSVGGTLGYGLAFLAIILIGMVLVTAPPGALKSFGALFRLELVLAGGAVLCFVAAAIFERPSGVQGLLPVVATLLAGTYLVLTSVKTFKLFRRAAHASE